MRILGLSCYYHDAAACLVEDGRIVAAAQEERFTRKRHDASFPAQAVRYCLAEAGGAIDAVAFYEKPLLHFHRILETSLGTAPRGLVPYMKALPKWMRHRLWIPPTIEDELAKHGAQAKTIYFVEHHESHAASAFFPSPFEEAAVLTLDGVGEWTTAAVGVGEGNAVRLLEEIRFPHSLGLLYSAFTYYCGFKVNSGEYKLMGLAPYGRPVYADLIRETLVHLEDDGSFRLDLDYFGYLDGLVMTNGRFHRLFGGPPRAPESRITRREMDLAASVQAVTEDAVLAAARHAHALTGKNAVCLAGGVALNCVANGRLLREGPFGEVFVQPAAGDAGGAVGAALAVWHHALGGPRTPVPGDAMQGAYLGPQFDPGDIRTYLDRIGAVYTEVDDVAWAARLAESLDEGRVVGLFQGRMELGPRALGNRSIVADPRRPEMQARLNLAVKQRESFRPFAPAVLEERAGEWFDLEGPSPYMLLVAPVRAERRTGVEDDPDETDLLARVNRVRSQIPAVTHVDGSARIQTVSRRTNPRFHALLEAFEARTGCPVLVNTSFNLRGEPIVATPEDAYRCFLWTEMDELALGPFLLVRTEQPGWEAAAKSRPQFDPD